jgi:F0F1-type ATP synthase delta subunit
MATSPDEERHAGRTVLRGRIISGMPLPVAAQKRIARSFEALLGSHVRLGYRMDRTLIAGVRVEIDGRAYDGSLQGQLATMRKVLTRHDEEGL